MRLWLLFFALIVVGCAQGHCRRKNDSPEMAAQPAVVASEAKPTNAEHVFVYKYDGSLQCGMGNPVSLEAMAKELQGLTIHSQSKKRDGLMHIQVCGSISGMANVFEIPEAQMKKAEAKGFKKWSFE